MWYDPVRSFFFYGFSLSAPFAVSQGELYRTGRRVIGADSYTPVWSKWHKRGSDGGRGRRHEYSGWTWTAGASGIPRPLERGRRMSTAGGKSKNWHHETLVSLDGARVPAYSKCIKSLHRYSVCFIIKYSCFYTFTFKEWTSENHLRHMEKQKRNSNIAWDIMWFW